MPPHPDVSWQLLQLGLPNLCPSKSIFDSNDWNVSPNRIYIFIAQTFQNLPHSVGHHWTSVSGENPWTSLATFCFFYVAGLRFWHVAGLIPIPHPRFDCGLQLHCLEHELPEHSGVSAAQCAADGLAQFDAGAEQVGNSPGKNGGFMEIWSVL